MTAEPIPRTRFTIAEYLALEEVAEEKHEYHDGEILAMSGGSYDHSRIITNAIIAIGNALRGKPCQNFEGNLRVRIPSARRYLYPDSTIICGPPEFDPDDPKRSTVINPRVIVEVLSPTTEAYDRGDKFDLYRKLDSLREYVLISQTQPRIEAYVRQPGGPWLFNPLSGLDATLTLPTVDIQIPAADIYAGVEFPPPAPIPDHER